MACARLESIICDNRLYGPTSPRDCIHGLFENAKARSWEIMGTTIGVVFGHDATSKRRLEVKNYGEASDGVASSLVLWVVQYGWAGRERDDPTKPVYFLTAVALSRQCHHVGENPSSDLSSLFRPSSTGLLFRIHGMPPNFNTR